MNGASANNPYPIAYPACEPSATDATRRQLIGVSAQMRSRHEIHEESHARRYGLARLEGREESNLVARVINQALDEASGLQILGHVPQRFRRQAAAFESSAVQHIAAAAGKMTPDRDLLDATLRAEPPTIVQPVPAGEA